DCHCSHVGIPVCLKGIFVLSCPKVHVSLSEYFLLHIRNVYREKNFVADSLANYSLDLDLEKKIYFDNSPSRSDKLHREWRSDNGNEGGEAQIENIFVAKMRVLRWICGHMRENEIRNEDIRGKLRVVESEDKMRKNWLRGSSQRGRGRLGKRLRQLGSNGKHKTKSNTVTF
ncbi:hypothetical protein DVH24_027588, partial [Malus domestica]